MAGILKKYAHFFAVNNAGRRQSARNAAMTNASLNELHRAAVVVGDVVDSTVMRDCGDRDPTGETVNGYYKTVTITYALVSARILAAWIAYFLGGSAAPTGTAQNEQQLVVGADIDGGAAAFTFSLEGLEGATEALSHDVSAAEFRAALEALEPIGEGNVSVTGDSIQTGFTVEYIGKLAKANMPLLTAGAGFTDGGSPVAPTITQSQAGGNKLHLFTRSVSDTLILLSIALGYENAEETVEKISNLCVSDVVVTLNKGIPVAVEVRGIAKFTTSDEPDFTVPECSAIDALEGDQVRLKIEPNWVTENLWSGTINLSNNVPTDTQTINGFTGKEIRFQERGKQPSYTQTIQLLGSKGDLVFEAAKNRETAAVEWHIGDPGNRVSIYFPNDRLTLQSKDDYVSSLEQSAYTIAAVAEKDGANAPINASYHCDQTTQFLTT